MHDNGILIIREKYVITAGCANACIQILEEFPDTEIPPLDEFLEMTIGSGEEVTTMLPEIENFDEKINEVMTMLTTSKGKEQMSPQNFKSLLGSLINTAVKDSRSREEHSEKMHKVENLVNVFMKENAQRAQQNLKERKPTRNPVREQNKKVQKTIRKDRYKNHPEGDTEVEDFPDYINEKDEAEEFNEAEYIDIRNGDVEENLPSLNADKVPFSEPLKEQPKTKAHFSDLLEIAETKGRMEGHIIDMIIDDPGNAANVLSDLFIHDSREDKLETKTELQELMAKDPMAVGAAFSDLITRHNMSLDEPRQHLNQQNANKQRFPRPIKTPPKEVQGQLLRIWSDHEVGSIENRPRQKATSNDGDDSKLPSDILNTMLKLIETGEMSSEDVIEQMINNGMLPVEVTDIGRLPITVGSGRDREAITLTRLQQLRVKEPSIVMKDDRHEMVEVGLDDPDFDVENLDSDNDNFEEDFGPIKTHGNLDTGVDSALENEEKDIDLEESLMTLLEQGLIDEDELKEMMKIMDLLPKDEVSDTETKRPIYKPPPITNVHSKNHYLTRGIYGNKHVGSAIEFNNQPPIQHQLRLKLPNGEKPSSYAYYEMQLGKPRGDSTPKINSHQPFNSAYSPKTSPYLPQDFHQAPRSIPNRSSPKTTPPRPKKHVRSQGIKTNKHKQSTNNELKRFNEAKDKKQIHNTQVHPIHEEPFFEALKLENPFKDEFDDDFDFDAGLPAFIPDFDNPDFDINYDDYDPYTKSAPDDDFTREKFHEEDKYKRPKFYHDSVGAPVLIVAPPPKPKTYAQKKTPSPAPKKLSFPNSEQYRADPKSYKSHAKRPKNYHPFKTSYAEAEGNYGQKRLEYLNPLRYPNYEKSLVRDEPETSTEYRRPKKDSRYGKTNGNLNHEAEDRLPDFEVAAIPNIDNEYTLRRNADLVGPPSSYNSPREPFAPPTNLRSHVPFLKSQDYGRDARRFSSRSDHYSGAAGHIRQDNTYGYSAGFDPFKELEESGIEMFGGPFESKTEGPQFSDFEFQQRIGHIDLSRDLVANEAGGGKLKRTGKVHGPMVKSRGEVTPHPRLKYGVRTGNTLSQGYGLHTMFGMTTVRPFAYTTSPKTGSKLGDDNIRDIQKSFIYGEKTSARFK